MARLIDADALIEMLNNKAKTDLEMGLYNHGVLTQSFIRFVERQPTVDVVPKSEVERLQKEADRYKRYYFRHDYDEMIAEVLDKLDGFINANCIEIKDERGIKGYVTSGVHFAIAELKKKYTEGV